MKYFILFFIAILFSCLFISCSNSTKYSTEIKQLDSISLALDSASIKFNSIDTTKLSNQLKEIKSDLKTCEENIKDTLTIETATFLSDYRSSKKPFAIILERYSTYSSDLIKSQKQIDDLIHDLKIEKVDEAKVASYVQEELIAASKVLSSIELSVNLSKIYSERFELNKSSVKTFINSIKK